MSEWSNPYEALQQQFRAQLKSVLKRTNGTVPRGQLLASLTTDDPAKVQKILQRLFNDASAPVLEWKVDFADRALVQKRLEGNKAVNIPQLLTVFDQSRKLSGRTAYPHIAPSNRENQLVSRNNMIVPPVFGVDVLVRPDCKFSSNRVGGALMNDLKVGEECIVMVIHGSFNESGKLTDESQYSTRLVAGSAFAIPRIAPEISNTAGRCERDIREDLESGNVGQAVKKVAHHLNAFADEASLAFVS